MATISSISSTNSVKDSRTTINTNFSNLNSDKVEANQVCMLTGEQTIAGKKIFSTIPETTTGTPTTSVQIVAKGHLNTYAMPLAWKSTDGTLATNTNSLIPTEKAVKTYADTKVGVTNTQTISGAKYFSTKPTTTTSSPTIDEQIVTKKYVDDVAISGSPNASETEKGIVEIATQSETNSGSTTGATGAILVVRPDRLLATTRVANAVQNNGDETINGVKTFGSIPVLPASDPTTDNQAVRKAYVDSKDAGINPMAAGDTVLIASNAERTNNKATYTLIKAIQILRKGTYRISYEYKSSNAAFTAFARIYINEVATGTQKTTTSTSYQSWSEDLTLNAGDKIELYMKTSDVGQSYYCQKFQVKVSAGQAIGADAVLTD